MKYLFVNINRLDPLNFIKSISSLYMFRARVLIVRRSKLYYTVSGIITLKQVSSLKLPYFSIDNARVIYTKKV